MRVQSIVNTFLNDVTPNMHKVRRASLNASLSSLLQGSPLSITGIGRNITSQTSEKHQIKRSMRLCRNPHLHTEIQAIYSMVVLRILHQQTQPIILVDWSDLDPRKQHFLLRASVAIEGRSLTLLEKIYTVHQKEKPAIHRAFMETLKAMLPQTCRPIIMSDAGFRVPWFSLIESLGWDYVGRVRNKTMCRQHKDEEWFLTRQFYQYASLTEKPLGRYQLRRKNSFESALVIYQKRQRGRKKLTATGQRSRTSSNSLANASREQEPWLLATSLPADTVREARKVVKIYRTRMQIEESFRDLKTELQFNHSQTRTLSYLAVLLLLAMLAQTILFLLGMAIKLTKRHLGYQANSLKNAAVLSYHFIGLRAFKDTTLRLKKIEWEAAYQTMQRVMAGHLVV